MDMGYMGIWSLVAGVILMGIADCSEPAGTPRLTATDIAPTQTMTKEKPQLIGVQSSTAFDPVLTRVVMEAREDLSRRLGIAFDQIDIVEVQSVVWPDKSLGCPQPGMGYLQVQVDGLLIRFHAGSRLYEYHSGGSRPPFLCEIPAGVSPGKNGLTAPPGSKDQ